MNHQSLETSTVGTGPTICLTTSCVALWVVCILTAMTKKQCENVMLPGNRHTVLFNLIMLIIIQQNHWKVIERKLTIRRLILNSAYNCLAILHHFPNCYNSLIYSESLEYLEPLSHFCGLRTECRTDDKPEKQWKCFFGSDT